jgi:arylsulfatase A-like enzyme
MVTRREILAAGAAAAVSTACSSITPDGRSTSRPNILFILADDLGWGDLSCYGRPDYRTPVLDELAGRGVRLTQAYANSSTCSPTRVGLITGRYQNRLPVGLYDPLPPGTPHGLPLDHPTLPSLLKKAGYATALVGKWHLGFPPAYGPLKSGYDEFFGLYGGGMTYFTHQTGGLLASPRVHALHEGDKPVKRDGYATDLFAERAVEFIQRAHGKPWFLSLHFTAPHWPWEGPNYKARAEKIREMAHFEDGSPRIYREMMLSLDASVGRVLAASGRAGNTLVVFTSDNGGERYSYYFPLRGEKGFLWEGGIRVPAIVVWPGVLPAGKVSKQVAMSMDWLPTLLAAAGTRPDPNYPADGVNLLPVLRGEVSEFARTVFWRTQDMGAARSGDWKYVRWGNHEYLFNLSDDETENANSILKSTTDFERVKAAYINWDAQMLPVPAEVRRGAYEVYYNRARTLEGLKKK